MLASPRSLIAETADGSRAQVFVAAMGASSYTFACATADQSMRSWLGAMARAMTFYGGCPQLIVPDNPRALVSMACLYEPKLNETVRDFARQSTPSLQSPSRNPASRLKPVTFPKSPVTFAEIRIQDAVAKQPRRQTRGWYAPLRDTATLANKAVRLDDRSKNVS